MTNCINFELFMKDYINISTKFFNIFKSFLAIEFIIINPNLNVLSVVGKPKVYVSNIF